MRRDLVDELLREARSRRSLPDPPIRRLLRERVGVSQEAVAQMLDVSRPTVTRWESGRRTPRGALLRGYADLLERLADQRQGASPRSQPFRVADPNAGDFR